MEFEEIQASIQSGDVLLFSGNALYSRVIKWWTRSVYSHVGVALKFRVGNTEYLDVIEAVEGVGVRQYPLEKYLNQGSRIDWFSITDDAIDRQKVVQWFMDRRANRYASPQQLFRSFITVPLAAKFGIPTLVDEDRFFCSFATAAALRFGGWVPPIGDSIDPELASPGDVSRFVCLQRRGPLNPKGR